MSVSPPERAGRYRNAMNAPSKATTAPTITVRLEGVDERLVGCRRDHASPPRRVTRRASERRRPDRVLHRVGQPRATPPAACANAGITGDRRRIDRRGDAAQDRHAEGAADLACRVVHRRADPGLLRRHRTHDRLRRRCHRQPHPGTDQDHEHDRDQRVAARFGHEREHEQRQRPRAQGPKVTTILVPNTDTNLALDGAAIINDAATGNSADAGLRAPSSRARTAGTG